MIITITITITIIIDNVILIGFCRIGILNTGEVPNLFNNEEFAAITEQLLKPAQVTVYI